MKVAGVSWVRLGWDLERPLKPRYHEACRNIRIIWDPCHSARSGFATSLIDYESSTEDKTMVANVPVLRSGGNLTMHEGESDDHSHTRRGRVKACISQA